MWDAKAGSCSQLFCFPIREWPRPRFVSDPLRKVHISVSEYLNERGYIALKAANGQPALDLADRHIGPIHLLLTDVIMPLRGLTTCGWA
jgi:CheY-like chemotaxis protein